MGQLLQIVHKHQETMVVRDELVEQMLQQYPSNVAEMFKAAKEASLKAELEILKSMDSESSMKHFLKDIIKIETEFNRVYEPLKKQQKEERSKIEDSISPFENKPKTLNEGVSSLGDLIFAQSIYIRSLENFLENVINECEYKGIVVYNYGANMKKIERSFYKCFYVYDMKTGHKEITDILRASIVFQSFRDLYGAFAIICKHAKKDETIGSILRVKDRFNPETVPFGYRDLLINLYIPGSKIVGEIQLHHKMFYDRKNESHTIYKKARLFEDVKTNTNVAYDIAVKRYALEFKDDDEKQIGNIDTAEKLANTISDEQKIMELIIEAEDNDLMEDMSIFCQRLTVIKIKNLKQDLSEDQRSKLLAAYKGNVNIIRDALRSVKNKNYRQILLKKLENICDSVFTILTDLADIVKTKQDAESECFYLKMAGDYCRYMAEFMPSKDLPYVNAAEDSYNKAMDAAAKLDVANVTRLGAALNFSVFYYEIAKEKDKAIETAQKAIDDVGPKMGFMSSSADQIVELLQQNITLWND